MRYVLAGLAIGICLVSAWASEPGQPLDCSDWVFLEPGLSCLLSSPSDVSVAYAGERFHVKHSQDEAFAFWTNPAVLGFDNEGRIMKLNETDTIGTCGSRPDQIALKRLELRRFDGANDVLVAFVAERCVDDILPRVDHVHFDAGTLDAENGRIALMIAADCQSREVSDPCYARETQFWALEGFTTAREILQNDGPKNRNSFRVPSMPEGFSAADSFDTFASPPTSPIASTLNHRMEHMIRRTGPRAWGRDGANTVTSASSRPRPPAGLLRQSRTPQPPPPPAGAGWTHRPPGTARAAGSSSRTARCKPKLAPT